MITAYEVVYDLPNDPIGIAVYFEENYIVGRRARGRRSNVPSRYPIHYWNCFDATIKNVHRSNISKGWHSRFQLVAGKQHPPLFSAVSEIIKKEAGTETILAQLALGQRVKAALNQKRRGYLCRIQRREQDTGLSAHVSSSFWSSSKPLCFSE